MWQETPYTIPLVVTAVILAVPALYVWQRHRVAAARTIVLILLAGIAWILVYVLELGSVDLHTKVFWSKLQYITVMTICLGWLIFTFQYSGRKKWVTRRNLSLLSIIPGITLGLVFTNEYHGLIWSNTQLIENGSFISSAYSHGVWFWVHTAYLYTLALVGAFLLVQMLFRSRYLYRWQIITLLCAVFFPMLENALYLSGLDSLSYLGLVVVTFPAVSLVVAWNLFRFRPEDIVPVARGAVIEGMSDAVIVLDLKNRIIDLNPAAQYLTGYTASEAVRQPIDVVWPGRPDQIGYAAEENADREVLIAQKDGEHAYDVRFSPLRDWRGDLISRVVVFRDVTERKRAEKEIKASLQEKEVLLREIHHRVKNNLQIITSLLNLQSAYVKDNTYMHMFKESRNRVKSMALIHEKLYQSDDLTNIDFREYVRTLVHWIVQSHGVSMERVIPTIRVEDVSFGVDAAIPCGLIINELVTNSLKHAFPEGKGEITVVLRSADGNVELVVADNGVGMPDNIDFKTTETLGLRLVTILAEGQLGGHIELVKGSGTEFHIRFKE